MMLPHITLATGHVSVHRLDTLEAGAVAACRGLLPAGGMVPGFTAFRVVVSGPVFTVWRGAEPVVSCGVCRGDDEVHGALREMQGRLVTVGAYAVPRGLWLAIVLLPGLLNLTREDVGWLGDFERCMAAAIIDYQQETTS